VVSIKNGTPKNCGNIHFDNPAYDLMQFDWNEKAFERKKLLYFNNGGYQKKNVYCIFSKTVKTLYPCRLI
jgi:hypothetical protein